MKKHLNDAHWRHKILPSALQMLYRPWLIALGLHGLLLIVPLPDHLLTESPKPLKEVKVTDLPASPKGSTSKSSPNSTSKPTSNASTPRPDVVTRPPSPTPTPSATPTPTPSAIPTPKPTTTLTSTPGVNIEGGELDKFLEELAANTEMSADKASQPTLNSFSEPRFFFDQLGLNPKPKSDILTMRLINGKTPNQVQNQVLRSQGKGRNFRSEQLDGYGGGDVYRVLRDNKVWYFNLVPTKDSSGTVVVVWKREPPKSR